MLKQHSHTLLPNSSTMLYLSTDPDEIREDVKKKKEIFEWKLKKGYFFFVLQSFK